MIKRHVSRKRATANDIFIHHSFKQLLFGGESLQWAEKFNHELCT